MIAILPLLCQKFWHKHFGNIAILMGGGMALYYIFGRHDTSTPSHTFFEYIQFISLISALYFAANGIMIRVNRSALPKVNAIFLFLGAVLSNLIGTTGASILLIKPFISLNEDRIKPFHVVFFIFVVSNVGGGLTPIGDPPLFLGFLKGVPFFWTTTHVFLLWLTALVLLCSLFFVIDHRALSADAQAQQAIADEEGKEQRPLLSIEGTKSFLWLGGIIGAVFLDPNVLDWVPALYLGEEKISFLRECILIACAFGAYKTARKDILIHNDFSFFPIKEVALLFVGIFGTMMPALQLIKHMSSDAGGLLTPSFLFWSTGLLSGFLDNAPTYLTFLAASMSSFGQDIHHLGDTMNYANGIVNGVSNPNTIACLKSISVSAVFFGAMTYIGNGPNFMVSSIARFHGIAMPSFFGYMAKYSLPILIPIFALIWLLLLLGSNF